MKRASIVSSIGDESVGNATIHPDHFDNNNNKNQRNDKNGANHLDRPQAPSPPQGSTTEDNQHYNDTIFGDEQPRTYSPNELDSLRNVYQRNVVDTPNEDKVRILDTTTYWYQLSKIIFVLDQVHTDDDAENDDIEEEIGKYNEDDDDDDDENDRFNSEKRANLADTQKSNTFGNTATSDGDIVKQTWDPNDTNKLPQEGNKENVIIEISSFTLKEGSQVLKRKDIKKLFVSMDFLNYDPSELESAMALPKPAPNEPSNYNFRKSELN